MTASQSQVGRSKSSIWDCLSADQIHAAGDDADLIALEDPVGLEIWQNNKANTQDDSQGQCTTLTQSNIRQWISTPPGSSDQLGRTLRYKLLVGNQVIGDDNLRPPRTANDIRFSRTSLCTNFGFPRVGVEEMSYRHPWCMDFVGATTSPCNLSFGFGTTDFSYSQHIDHGNRTLCGVVVFFSSIPRDARKKFLAEFKLLEHLSDELTFVPYLILNLFIRTSSKVLSHYDSLGTSADLSIQRYADSKTLDSRFGHAHVQITSVSAIEDDIGIVLGIAQRYNSGLGERPPAISDDLWLRIQVQHEKLAEGFRFVVQKLRATQLDAQRCRGRLTRQLGIFQHVNARELQEASIQLATASKLIAEEAKKDGISMKTLAVVATLYLPATTVATILDMPLFSWTAETGLVADPHIWIFVVIALSLTGLTVVAWWLWQRRIFRKRGATTDEKDALP